MKFRRTITIEIEAVSREALARAAGMVAEAIAPDVDTLTGSVGGRGQKEGWEYTYQLNWDTKAVDEVEDPDAPT